MVIFMRSRYDKSFDSAQKDIAIKIVAITVSELNDRLEWSKIPGLRIGITRCIGQAHHKENRITIPIWVLKRSIHFVRYYVCHEIAHLIAGTLYGLNEKHGPNFKKIERLFCAAFDIRLAFPARHHNRAYPIAICGPNEHFERNGN